LVVLAIWIEEPPLFSGVSAPLATALDAVHATVTLGRKPPVCELGTVTL
jgi:hypothetical protein